MWSAHHHWDTGGTDRIGHAVGLRDHSGHRADSNQANILFADKSCDARLIHGLCVSVDQNDFVAGGSQRLEKKHPQMWHEIARDPIIRVVQQYPHQFLSTTGSCISENKKGKSGRVSRFCAVED
jgi:hypothetical protein